MTTQPHVFLDAGEVLGMIYRRDRAVAVQPRRSAVAMCEELLGAGARLGVVCSEAVVPASAAERALRDAGLLDHFDPELRWLGADHLGQVLCKARAAVDPALCVFVGHSLGDRWRAARAGMRPVPHPALAADVMRGAALYYVRIAGRAVASRIAAIGGVVPVHLTSSSAAFAVATSDGVERLVQAELQVHRCGAPGVPATTTLFLAHTTGTAGVARVVATSHEGVYLALGVGDDIEDYVTHDAPHGSTRRLLPDPTLATSPNGLRTPHAPPHGPARLWTDDERAALDAISSDSITATAHRLAEPLASRHIAHADNAYAVAWIADELQRIGGDRLAVRRHAFTYDCRGARVELDNVEAELPGAQPELVLVTAPLDSCVRESSIAAVLAIARALVALPRLQRTVRFVLFNAEHQGMIGSQAYASSARDAGADIAAVFELGRRAGAQPELEADPHLDELAAGLAGNLEQAVVAGHGGPLARLSIATTRSSFLSRGYAACAVCADDTTTTAGVARVVAAAAMREARLAEIREHA